MNKKNVTLLHYTKDTLVKIKKILLSITLFLMSGYLIAADITGSVDVTLSLNVVKTDPVCKLSATSKTIDFGDIDAMQIVRSPPVGEVTFNFTDCIYVNNIGISFVGPNLDTSKNYISNSIGTDKAKGIAIKLFDSNSQEINLMQKNNIKPDSDDKANLILKAMVVTTEQNKEFGVKSGFIDTAIALEITYDE